MKDEKRCSKLMYCIQTEPAWRHTHLILGNLTNSKEINQVACYRLQNTCHTLSRIASTNKPTDKVWNFHAPLRLLVTFELPAVTLSRGLGRQKGVKEEVFAPPGKCDRVQAGWRQSPGCWRRWRRTSFARCSPPAACPAPPSACNSE